MGIMTRRGRSADNEPVAEINVTPFVDVVLVLLIIFMITAAVVEFGMQVGVPSTAAAKANQPKKPNIVSVASDGRLFYDRELINIYDIADRARKASGKDGPAVYVQVHRQAAYQHVAQVFAELKTADVKINLVPKPLRRNPRAR